MPTKMIYKDEFEFNGAALSNRWTPVLVGSATAAVNAGQVDLSLIATNEVESSRISFADQLAYPIGNIIEMSFWAKITANLPSQVTVSMGLASAGNAAPTSITARAMFRAVANNNVVINTSDGTLTNSDVSADGYTLANSFKKFTINFADGTATAGPPISQKGGQGGQRDILFRMENQVGANANNLVLRQVARRTLFDMGNYAAGLQPYFQIQKTSSAAVAVLSVRRVEISYKL